MYTEDCDTGSQPRKAISHIFGRNKLCTRLIPAHVWVHYCRKHYQRSRYRNSKDYPKLQCVLVQQQIQRVHAWGLENPKYTVLEWNLEVRKRERQRLGDLDAKLSRKRLASATAEIAEGEMEEETTDDGSSTTVPEWLLKKCGLKYSTAEILAIFDQLHESIRRSERKAFPDIEILPNIIVTRNDEASSTQPRRPSRTPSLMLATSSSRASQQDVGLACDRHSPEDATSPKKARRDNTDQQFPSPAEILAARPGVSPEYEIP